MDAFMPRGGVEYTDWKAAIGVALKRYRETSGLTLNEAASGAKIRPELLHSIESGHGYLTLQQLYRLSHALNVPLSQLLLDTETRPVTSEVRDFIDAFSKIKDPKLKDQISDLVTTVLHHMSTDSPKT